MPLEIQIERDDKILEGIKWDYTTLSMLLTIALREGDPNREWQKGKKNLEN